MARSIMSSLACLSGIVVMSTVLISSYLFMNAGPPRKAVHLIPNQKYSGEKRFVANRLYDEDTDQIRNDEWMQEFVLKGDIAQPHRQLAREAARKFDLASASLPDSEDDYVKKEVPDGRLSEPWKEIIQKEEAKKPVVPKLFAAASKPRSGKHSNISQVLAGKRNSKSDENSAKICKPLTSVAMIKTHKCSSSTLQNILFRKAEDLELSIAIPKENVYFGSPSFFSRRFIFLDAGRKKYNIMASHMRFKSLKDVEEVMAPGAKYITILRDPARQFESIFTYYGWRTRFRADLHTFLQRPDRYFQLFEPRSTRVAGRNPMCYDNGLDARRLLPGNGRLESFIDILDNWYDLVLIAEHFDESLILLKDLMCWTLDDMVYFSQNARNNKSVVPLSRADTAAIRSWNWADQKLYSHFNKTLWERIEIFGRDRMDRELRSLAEKNAALSKDCIGKVMEQGDKRMWYPPGIKVNSFIVNENATHQQLCEQLTQPELDYLHKFRNNLIKDFQRQRAIS